MKKNITKPAVILIFIAITTILVISYKTIASQEKKIAELEKNESDLKKEVDNTKIMNEKVVADFSKQFNDTQYKLQQRDAQIVEFNNSKINLEKQLGEANIKLSSLLGANNFLEKQAKQLQSEIDQLFMAKKSLETELRNAAGQSIKRRGLNISINKENINYLKQMLDRKEKERLNLKKELDNLNSQKASLEKEVQIINQEKETLQSQSQVLEDDIYTLQLRYKDVESKLNLAQQQQKKTSDELKKAITLNASLQQNLVNLSQLMTQEEEIKVKAKDLKHKVEVILMPQGPEAKKE